jgi:hypothetical protein
MIPITINNINYRSISAAWRAVSPPTLKEITVRLRLRNGWDVTDAFLTDTVPAQDRRRFKNLRT